MQPVVDPVPAGDLLSELTRERFVRHVNNGSNEVYVVTHLDSPSVMREIGRLRELSFRAAGGGTGRAMDIDDYDTAESPYKQLIVWNPEAREIVGGYRYIRCDQAPVENGEVRLATCALFGLSDRFKKEFMPFTIELGRSFVQPKYQPSAGNRKGLFSLDNLWDGLGALTVDNPDILYYFGKVTMYPHFNREARDMILYFMHHFFPDPDKLAWPHEPLPITHDMQAFGREIEGKEYKAAHAVLNKHVRDLGENIPPLVNSYMNLSATMRTLGTALNAHFGSVEETGIMVVISDIYPTKKNRHLETYLQDRAKRES